MAQQPSQQPPPQFANFRDAPDYKGQTEVIVNSTLIGLSALFLGLRLYVRAFMTKSLGLDDTVAGLAFALLVAQSGMDINAVSYGSGAHLRDVPNPLRLKFFESLLIQTLVYFIAVAMVRYAILVFLPRLGRDKWVNRSIWVVGVMIFAQTVICIVFRLTECTPVADNFKPPTFPGLKCKSPKEHNHMMVGHAISGIVIDVALMIMPIWLIYSKMIWSKRTIQVILVMSVGAFAVVTGVVRLILMMTLNFAADITFQMATLGVWTNLEGHVGLWCCCFPALQPILRIVSYKLGLRSTLMSGKSGKSGKSKYGASHQSHKTGGSGSWSRSATKSGYVKSGSAVDDTDTESQRQIVKDGSDVELSKFQFGESGIHKTTEVQIRSEPMKDNRKSRSWVDMSA